MRQVYENLELIRAAMGITKRSISQKVGVSEMRCNRMLWGEVKIPADLVKPFANSIGVQDLNVLYNDALTDSVIHQYTATGG